MTTLTAKTYLDAFKKSLPHKGITGGTIHEFLRNSCIEYYGGKCPVYYVCYYHNGHRCVIGGNYVTNGESDLKAFSNLDFN